MISGKREAENEPQAKEYFLIAFLCDQKRARDTPSILQISHALVSYLLLLLILPSDR